MGWVGVANLSALIIIVIVFKTFLIDYMTTSVKAHRVEGYSEFNLVYTNTKELSAVDLPELNKILQIIENNPIDFRRCFPKADLNITLKNVKEAIAAKIHQKSTARIRTAEEQVEYQKLTLELSRSTTVHLF